MQLEDFVVIESASLRDALTKIETNRHGMILTVDVHGAVTGLATDGDIRRRLLEGGVDLL